MKKQSMYLPEQEEGCCGIVMKFIGKVLILALLILFFSCKKDDPDPDPIVQSTERLVEYYVECNPVGVDITYVNETGYSASVTTYNNTWTYSFNHTTKETDVVGFSAVATGPNSIIYGYVKYEGVIVLERSDTAYMGATAGITLDYTIIN